jgi:acetylornithine deacetylase
MSEVADLTRDLVAVASHDSEAAAGDRIEEWLRAETDADVTRDDAGADEGRGGNVIARTGSGDPTLALVGHHDVVPPDDRQVDGDGGYVVATRDGRIHGRGSADMKGAVAAAMLAFRDSEVRRTSGNRTQSGDAGPAGELVFASFVGAEEGGVGARHAIEAGFAPDLALVGEGSTGYSSPGTTDVAVAHKGRRGSTVVGHGEAAHASEPGAGENAIYRAADAVDVLRDLAFPSTTVAGEAVEGSLVATMVEGGSAWNVVPERCAVTVDERTVPGERAPLERVEGIAGVEWTVDQDLPPMACGDDAFADAALAAADAAQDGDPAHVVKPHATDAGWLAQAGTECVVCGPAEQGEAHTDDERVSVAVLERCRRIYRRVAERPRAPETPD